MQRKERATDDQPTVPTIFEPERLAELVNRFTERLCDQARSTAGEELVAAYARALLAATPTTLPSLPVVR